MFTSIEQFKNFWVMESEKTRKIMGALTEESLDQKVADKHRDLKRIAWHIVTTIPDMAGRTGLKIQGPKESDSIPESAKEIKIGYEKAASSLLDQVTNNWDDETLKVTDDMYGEQWTRSQSLHVLAIHEIHHRGQMTVLMRQAGLTVPGIYGPAKEEWAQYGMKEPEI